MKHAIIEMAQGNGGIVSASEVTAAGLPRRLLAEAVDRGALRKVARGLYALPDAWEDGYLVAQHRFRRGVFSHGTALFLHDMTDVTPSSLAMTFPHGYNTSAVREAGIIAKTVAPGLIDLGKTTVATPMGGEVVAYDVERTLCDIVRGKATPDVELVNPAMKAYASSRKKDINKLLGYARKLGVEGKVGNYMEVLL